MNRRIRVQPIVVSLLTLVVASGALRAQSPDPSAAERIRATLSVLAADSLAGRGTGSPEIQTAAQFLAEQFRAAGLAAGMPDGSYLQEFTVDSGAPAVQHVPGVAGSVSWNIVGLIRGTGSGYVIVGAHYDHLGRGGFGSLDPDSTGVVHNGADDNASGTVAVLEAARLLRDVHPVRTLVFIAFSGEEFGLLGSAAFVREALFPMDSVYAMVNLDMVGRLRNHRLSAFGAASAEEFGALLTDINAKHEFELNASGDGYGSGDHASFYAAGIPVIHLFTGTHEDYHRTTDDWDKINITGLDAIAHFTADLARTLADRTGGLTYVEAPPPTESSSGRGYGAYLGTIPDMTENPGGVRITGVRAGSPADAAGLQGGDIIVRIGTFDIGDLFAMTDALRQFQSGDKTIIAFRREGEVIEREVTFGRRGGR